MMQNSANKRKTTKEIGDYAEQLAYEYLLTKDFRLVKLNYRYKNVGEIDLVMKDADTLVFVEVRYRASSYYGTPEATVGKSKQRKLRRTAEAFLLAYGITEQACRFDVVAVDLIGGTPVIRHLINCI